MGTNIRPESSQSNEYWIPRDRYYELAHFCLQYPAWVEFCREADSTSKVHLDKPLSKRIFGHSDPVVYAVELRERYFGYISIVKAAAEETDICSGGNQNPPTGGSCPSERPGGHEEAGDPRGGGKSARQALPAGVLGSQAGEIIRRRAGALTCNRKGGTLPSAYTTYFQFKGERLWQSMNLPNRPCPSTSPRRSAISAPRSPTCF